MKIFFSSGIDMDGKNVVEENETNALDVCSSKFIISIRTSGIQVKNRETKELVDLRMENIVFDGNIDLT